MYFFFYLEVVVGGIAGIADYRAGNVGFWRHQLYVAWPRCGLRGCFPAIVIVVGFFKKLFYGEGSHCFNSIKLHCQNYGNYAFFAAFTKCLCVKHSVIQSTDM